MRPGIRASAAIASSLKGATKLGKVARAYPIIVAPTCDASRHISDVLGTFKKDLHVNKVFLPLDREMFKTTTDPREFAQRKSEIEEELRHKHRFTLSVYSAILSRKTQRIQNLAQENSEEFWQGLRFLSMMELWAGLNNNYDPLKMYNSLIMMCAEKPPLQEFYENAARKFGEENILDRQSVIESCDKELLHQIATELFPLRPPSVEAVALLMQALEDRCLTVAPLNYAGFFQVAVLIDALKDLYKSEQSNELLAKMKKIFPNAPDENNQVPILIASDTSLVPLTPGELRDLAKDKVHGSFVSGAHGSQLSPKLFPTMDVSQIPPKDFLQIMDHVFTVPVTDIPDRKR